MTTLIPIVMACVATLPIAALAWGAVQESIWPTHSVDDEGTVE